VQAVDGGSDDNGVVSSNCASVQGCPYKDFLTLWKDTDSDIPILKQAKAEYAKLQ
jgi:hypothetical protein